MGAANLYAGARARGTIGNRDFYQARVESLLLSSMRDEHRTLFVRWSLDAPQQAQGESAIEFAADQPPPRTVAVAQDPVTHRWYARDDLASPSNSSSLGIYAAILLFGLIASLCSLAMISVRTASARALEADGVDHRALFEIAKDPPTARRFFASRALASIALYLGLHLVSLAVVTAASSLIWLMIRAGRFNLAIATLAGGALYAVARVYLDPPTVSAPSASVHLCREDHPRFFAELDRLAQNSGFTAPDAVAIDNTRSVRVRDTGSLLDLSHGERLLVLGLPLIEKLSVSELRAAIAHALSPFATTNSTITSLLLGVRAKAQAFASSAEHVSDRARTLPIHKPYQWYLELFLFVTHKLAKVQALCADRAAITAAGRDAHRRALLESDEIECELPLPDRLAFAEYVQEPKVTRDERPALSLFDHGKLTAKRLTAATEAPLDPAAMLDLP